MLKKKNNTQQICWKEHGFAIHRPQSEPQAAVAFTAALGR